jgi:hypothetical protein
MGLLAEKTKDLLKMLGSTIVVVSAGVWVLSHELRSVSDEIHCMEIRLNEKIDKLDKRVTVIETVLIMQGYPIKNIAAQPEKGP